MATFLTYFPPEDSGSFSQADFRLVRDEKSPWALIAPPFWLAWHRLWLPLLAYLVLMTAIGTLALWQPGLPALYLSALPGFYFFLEGSELIRSSLERKGWSLGSVVEAGSQEEAEIRVAADAMLASRWESVSYSGKPAELIANSHSISPTGLFPE